MANLTIGSHYIPKQVAPSIAKDERLYQEIKEEDKEVIVMCESLDRMREEYGKERFLQGEAAGIQRGKAEGILTILKTLLQKGISDSYILDINGVSSELLLKAKQELN